MGQCVRRTWWELVREGAEEVRRRHRVAPVAGSAGVARRTVPDVGRVTSGQAPWPEAGEAGLGPAGGVARGRGGTHGTRPRVCPRRRVRRHLRDPPAGPRPQAQDAARPAGRERRGPQGQDALAGGPRPRQGGAHGGADRRARIPQGKGEARARGAARARPPPCGRRLRRRGLAHPRGHAPRRDLRPGVRRAHRRRDDRAPGRLVGPRPRPGDDGPVRGVRRGRPPDARPCRAPGRPRRARRGARACRGGGRAASRARDGQGPPVSPPDGHPLRHGRPPRGAPPARLHGRGVRDPRGGRRRPSAGPRADQPQAAVRREVRPGRPGAPGGPRAAAGAPRAGRRGRRGPGEAGGHHRGRRAGDRRAPPRPAT